MKRSHTRSADSSPTTPTRRAFLRAAAAVGAGGTVLASVPTGRAQSDVDYGGWFDGVQNYDGTVDRRGEDAVTVEVGASGNGGTFAYSPPAVRVDPGTTVAFEWVSDTHNVVPETQPSEAGWEGYSAVSDQGTTYEFPFEVEGIYTYYCDPHRSLGMKGAIVVGDVVGGGGEGGGLPIEAPMLGVGALVLGTAAFAAGTVAGARLRRRQVTDTGLAGIFLLLVGLLVMAVVVSKLVWAW